LDGCVVTSLDIGADVGCWPSSFSDGCCVDGRTGLDGTNDVGSVRSIVGRSVPPSTGLSVELLFGVRVGIISIGCEPVG
jgi:hypothetical protein